MNKGNKLYEGKAKIIYETKDKNLVIQHFKDDATAFNNQKKAKVDGKGVLNNRISEYILTSLSQCGIKTHLVKRLNMREQVIKFVEKGLKEKETIVNGDDSIVETSVFKPHLKAGTVAFFALSLDALGITFFK